jgi:two-component system nitrogen regulation response regulator NtrX
VIQLLIVDDVAAMAEQYAYDLRRLGGYETLVAMDGTAALRTLGEEVVDCVILDLEMPGLDGFGVLEAMGEKKDTTPVIVYTGTGDFDRCVRAVRLGAYGFIDKSEPVERVMQEVENALRHRRLEQEVRALRERLGSQTPLVGESGAMKDLREALARIAPVPSPVLIQGESGSGKELVARELHRLGPAPQEPFLAINCAALPEQLVESELFGHERGAFTGAVGVRKGAFEGAGAGTLFMDEIGELATSAQAKLLRVLEQREVTRLGGNRTIAVRARVVAATNLDLDREVSEGRFREDLFFRLNVHVLKVPALRERLSDLPELARHLVVSICSTLGVPPKELTGEALGGLMVYDWRRNNVRELRNILERMVIATDGSAIGFTDVPLEVRGPAKPPEKEARTFRERKAEAERQILITALERNDWHITHTARELGLADHASLLKIMRRHGLRSPESR